MQKHIYILFFFSFCASFCFAQTEEVRIKVYGFEDGLSHRNVFKIQQDAKGYIWLGTFNGLNRFDGVQFEVFDYQKENASNRYVSDLTIDKAGNLYVLDDTGIYRFHPDKENENIYQAKDKQGNLINKIFLDQQEQLWYTTFSTEFKHSKLYSPSVRPVIPLDGNYPNKPLVSSKTSIYAATGQNQVQQLDFEGNLKNTFDLPVKQRIVQLQIAQNQQLWALTEKGGLYSIEQGKFIAHPLSNELDTNGSTMNTFWVEENGDIWLGGFSSLWHYNAITKKRTNFNNRIRTLVKQAVNFRQIFQDQQGLIWVATDFGAVKISSSNQLFQNYMHEGSEYCDHGVCSMRGITGNGKNKIYFSYYNSIHELNTDTDEIIPLFRSFPFFNSPFGILYQNEQIYMGNGRKIDLQTLQVDTLFESQPMDKGVVCMDSDSLIWIGFENVLHLFDQQDNTVSLDVFPVLQDSLPSEITYIYQGKHQQYIWLSTKEDGLFRFSKKENSLTQINSQNSNLSNDRILVTYEDKQQRLWIATANGLNQLDIRSGLINVKTSEHGLANNFINGLLSEGDTCIWLSTDNGLSRYSMAEDQFTNYYQQDGLSSNEFNRISFHQSPDGRMYFGGLNGVNAFFPSEQFTKEKERSQATLLFTSFARYDGRIDSLLTQKTKLYPDSLISLLHTDKFFTLDFALADYMNPSQNKYSYMLEGFEPSWSKASNNSSARYYNIPPGDYIFKVRASSVGENWNDEILQIPIRIEDAFYNTWWFLLLSLFLASTLLWGLFRYRIYRIEQGRETLEKEVQIRTQELKKEKQKSDELLLNILPADIAEELKKNGKAKAKRHEAVTVFFSDFKGFSKIAEQMEPERLVAEIDLCFRAFDEIMDVYGLEKIKTIGDAYMCAGGMSASKKNTAVKVVQASLEIQAYMTALAIEKQDAGQPFFEARIGIHTGSVVAGIVGIRKFAYDIWGDTVNIAARMEQNGSVGKVNISEATYLLVKDQFHCTYRGKMEVKNKGMVDMYFVDGKK